MISAVGVLRRAEADVRAERGVLGARQRIGVGEDLRVPAAAAAVVADARHEAAVDAEREVAAVPVRLTDSAARASSSPCRRSRRCRRVLLVDADLLVDRPRRSS
jgi:hypothetical protein